MPLQPGSTLGSYEILSVLGAGGMGEVYKAKDARLDRLVAIKVLSDSWRQDPSFLARFEREANVLASLSHPNIASIFDFGEVDGRAFSVMELLDGRSDLFALGCVLYEMGAGAKAFESETPMGTLHAILTQDPDYENQGLVPPLRTLLRHCLAKPPEQRYQDAQDLAFALDTLGQPSSGAAQALPNPAPRRRAWSLARIRGPSDGRAGWRALPPRPETRVVPPTPGRLAAPARHRLVFTGGALAHRVEGRRASKALPRRPPRPGQTHPERAGKPGDRGHRRGWKGADAGRA
jgi:serine/threonine protein kinase